MTHKKQTSSSIPNQTPQTSAAKPKKSSLNSSPNNNNKKHTNTLAQKNFRIKQKLQDQQMKEALIYKLNKVSILFAEYKKLLQRAQQENSDNSSELFFPRNTREEDECVDKFVGLNRSEFEKMLDRLDEELPSFDKDRDHFLD